MKIFIATLVFLFSSHALAHPLKCILSVAGKTKEIHLDFIKDQILAIDEDFEGIRFYGRVKSDGFDSGDSPHLVVMRLAIFHGQSSRSGSTAVGDMATLYVSTNIVENDQVISSTCLFQ